MIVSLKFCYWRSDQQTLENFCWVMAQQTLENFQHKLCQKYHMEENPSPFLHFPVYREQ